MGCLVKGEDENHFKNRRILSHGERATALPFVAGHTKEFDGFFGFIVAIKKYRGISAVRIMAGCAGQVLAGF